jgi:hypothetical protein
MATKNFLKIMKFNNNVLPQVKDAFADNIITEEDITQLIEERRILSKGNCYVKLVSLPQSNDGLVASRPYFVFDSRHGESKVKNMYTNGTWVNNIHLKPISKEQAEGINDKEDMHDRYFLRIMNS